MRPAYIFRIDMECVRRTPRFHKKAGIPSDKDKNLTGFLHKIFQYQAWGTSIETEEHRKNSERIVEHFLFSENPLALLAFDGFGGEKRYVIPLAFLKEL